MKLALLSYSMSLLLFMTSSNQFIAKKLLSSFWLCTSTTYHTVFPYSPIPQATFSHQVDTNLIVYWMNMNLSPEEHAPIIWPQVLGSRFSLNPPCPVFWEGMNSDYSLFGVKTAIAHRRVGPEVLLGNTLEQSLLSGWQVAIHEMWPCSSLLFPLQQMEESLAPCLE